MKKILKAISIVLGIIIILGLVFFVIDYNRVKTNERPMFCIKNPAGAINDGGTVEFFGIGYKVIDFHTIAGFDNIKIGTWFMNYDDFYEEKKEYEMKFEDKLKNESNINSKVTTIDIETAFTTSESLIYTLNQEEIYQIFNIIDNADFSTEVCDGLPNYYIKYNSENEKAFVIYGIEINNNKCHITSVDGEAILSNEQIKKIVEMIDKYFN